MRIRFDIEVEIEEDGGGLGDMVGSIWRAIESVEGARPLDWGIGS